MTFDLGAGLDGCRQRPTERTVELIRCVERSPEGFADVIMAEPPLGCG